MIYRQSARTPKAPVSPVPLAVVRRYRRGMWLSVVIAIVAPYGAQKLVPYFSHDLLAPDIGGKKAQRLADNVALASWFTFGGLVVSLLAIVIAVVLWLRLRAAERDVADPAEADRG